LIFVFNEQFDTHKTMLLIDCDILLLNYYALMLWCFFWSVYLYMVTSSFYRYI